ncbi:hypothetical protein GR217_29610 [Rhizobium leguminosarum]|uniref:Uncharacterized protein n=1 Tax=Rhizobium ruizarguesonis TaxID=2081791 RepID=A0AAE4YX09_9HYPH|nr:hypothetical protein [Rhizobium ruizarguesonis]
MRGGRIPVGDRGGKLQKRFKEPTVGGTRAIENQCAKLVANFPAIGVHLSSIWRFVSSLPFDPVELFEESEHLSRGPPPFLPGFGASPKRRREWAMHPTWVAPSMMAFASVVSFWSRSERTAVRST